MKPQNVQIAYDDFILLLDTIRYIDPLNYAEDFQAQLQQARAVLESKQKRIELRETYGRVITAKTEEQKHNARMNYLQEKREIKDIEY